MVNQFSQDDLYVEMTFLGTLERHGLGVNIRQAGILFTAIGYSRLPERFRSHLDTTATFAHSDYTFGRVVEVCTRLARQAVVRYGGKIERGRDGVDIARL